MALTGSVLWRAVRSIVATSALVSSAAAQIGETPRRSFDVESLRRFPGPPWNADSSKHFLTYTERDVSFPVSSRAMLDSLEVAWSAAQQLLGVTLPDTTRATVFVTASRTRFAPWIVPAGRGITQVDAQRHVITVLVHNDSVKPYARHEVMHIVSRLAWGGPVGGWLDEGLGVLADGVCQGVPNVVAARDIMRWSPVRSAFDFTTRFYETIKVDRAGTYVLAGSMAEYLWETVGRAGFKDLWRGGQPAGATLPPASLVGSSPGFAAAPQAWLKDPTPAWREWVIRKAGNQPGLDSASYHRYGCK